jgi:uncharacterized protein (DUF697 family)
MNVSESQYEDLIRRDLLRWEREVLAPPGLIERTSKKVQTKIHHIIPEKIHAALTAAVRGIVKSVLLGLEYVPKGDPLVGLPLQESDDRAKNLLATYKKIAAAEGAGTGAGGILLGIVDFPALIAIKMKCLFELAHLYGYDTRDYTERLYLLYVFQLAFSSQEKRRELYDALYNWNETRKTFPLEEDLANIDWEQFQREYRDAIDFRKMLQLVPGIGAVVGAWANYGLVDELGTTAMNCFRLRALQR